MKNILISFLTIISVSALWAQQDTSPFAPSKNAPNVIAVIKDTIYLTTSTTYAYTVDTPMNEGLIRTGLTVETLGSQIVAADGSIPDYSVNDSKRNRKIKGYLVSGDIVETTNGKDKRNYVISVKEGALSPVLSLSRKTMTVDAPEEIILDFVAGQRSPQTTVRLYIPKGVNITLDNTTVDVIGRGEVSLRNLPKQSIGKTGTNYSYKKVGDVAVSSDPNGQIITFTALDLRPLNGIDIRLRIKGVKLPKLGEYNFKSSYSTNEPKKYNSYITPLSTATVTAVSTVADFRREMPVMFTLKESPELYLKPKFEWSPPDNAKKVTLMASTDNGKSWKVIKEVKTGTRSIISDNLQPDVSYHFKLIVEGGANAGESNVIRFRSGKHDIKTFGVKGDGISDDTDAVNKAIEAIYGSGGGVLSFTSGTYQVRTVHLKSNVWLHVEKETIIKCLTGNDAPETTWFSDRLYRSGLSPTDPSPYAESENYLIKQDVGHTYFRNTMFFAERERNIKIFGNGRISGNGSLVTGDRVMNNDPEKRADKMFTFKLCTQIEIGGYDINKDMWYDPEKDEPYYIGKGGKKNFELDNVLHIDQGGHFVLLATGTDTLNVHDTYFGKHKSGMARDIYDFMACNRVTATNIYSKMSSDDIIKLGSDCSLGFTRPVNDYIVRNIMGDTNCNLLQIAVQSTLMAHIHAVAKAVFWAGNDLVTVLLTSDCVVLHCWITINKDNYFQVKFIFH